MRGCVSKRSMGSATHDKDASPLPYMLIIPIYRFLSSLVLLLSLLFSSLLVLSHLLSLPSQKVRLYLHRLPSAPALPFEIPLQTLNPELVSGDKLTIRRDQ